MSLLAVEFYVHLPILVVAVSLVYSATRYDDWPDILAETRRNGVKIVTFLLAVGLLIFALSTWV